MAFPNYLANYYKKNGFLVLEQVIPEKVLDDISQEFRDIFKTQLRKLGKNPTDSNLDKKIISLYKDHPEIVINCGKAANHTISLWKLATSDTLLNLVTQLGIEDPSIAIRPVLLFNNKHIAAEEYIYKTPPHADFNSFRGSLNSIVLWLPLRDITTEIGPLEVVPGSHLEGNLATKIENGFGVVDKYEDKDFTPLLCDKGDAIIFSSLLVHRSGNNLTDDQLRLSISFRFNDLSSPDWIERKYFSTTKYSSDIGEEDLNYPTPHQMEKALYG